MQASQTSFKGYLNLKSRIIANCKIELFEPLHVGKGRDPANSSILQMIKDASGRPLIPGSTIRGCLRALLTRLLSPLEGKPIGIGGQTITIHKVACPKIEEKEIDLEQGGSSTPGAIDLLFGFTSKKQSFASPLKITDAEIHRESVSYSRTHVSIDLDRDAAKRGMLVTVESVPGGTRDSPTTFKFKIIYDYLDDQAMVEAHKVFLILINMLNKGIDTFIGGWKSRGYGHVLIKIEEMYEHPIDKIVTGEKPTQIQNVSDWISQEITALGGEE